MSLYKCVCLGVWVSGCLGVWVSGGCLGVSVSGGAMCVSDCLYGLIVCEEECRQNMFSFLL